LPAPNPPLILDCSILLVHDGKAAPDAPWAVLAQQGYRLLYAQSAVEAMQIFSRAGDIAVVVIDLAEAGLSLLHNMRGRGHGAVEYLLFCDRSGTPDSPDVEYLTRPFSDDRLIGAVSDAYNTARMQRFRLAEMQSLEESLAQFKAQTQAAITQLIARAQNGHGAAAPLPAIGDAGLAPFIGDELSRARLREKLFGAVGLRHSGWMLLLMLAEAQAGGSELTIKGAAYSAGLPLSSALRTINEMCAGGLIARRGDAKDARRSFITLTPLGQSQFARYAAAFAQEK
jgi:DNA-binding MarR family transcriptional regulator/FixJ family two-component response regulator